MHFGPEGNSISEALLFIWWLDEHKIDGTPLGLYYKSSLSASLGKF